jgi:hypothetical protein
MLERRTIKDGILPNFFLEKMTAVVSQKKVDFISILYCDLELIDFCLVGKLVNVNDNDVEDNNENYEGEFVACNAEYLDDDLQSYDDMFDVNNDSHENTGEVYESQVYESLHIDNCIEEDTNVSNQNDKQTQTGMF